MKFHRLRMRLIKWKGFHYIKDEFSQGDVYSIWLGFLLIRLMMKRMKKVLPNYLAEHDVLLSFYGSGSAIMFSEWWEDQGHNLFYKWILEQNEN